jgi:diacylglycerol kinase (ATP)
MAMKKDDTKTLLVFNPTAGAPEDAPSMLMDTLIALQKVHILPKVYLVTPESELDVLVREAVRGGTRLVVVHGGDGTIDKVAGGMAGTQAAMGIVPGGTQNNVARSLGIPPGDIEAAVSILQEGVLSKLDMGTVSCGPRRRYFLETSSVGLISELYPAADEIQHGNLARLGDLLTTLFTSTPSRMRLNLDWGSLKLETTGHILLAANMPYFGPQFQPAANISCQDGLLDVFVFSDLTMLDLLGYAVMATGGPPQDTRVQHFRAKSITVETEPKMRVMADGNMLGEETARIAIKPGCLNVMTPKK